MPLYQYKEFQPTVEDNCFIADSAQIMGRAYLANGVNIWFGTVVRADVNTITIGENTNIQDLSMLHVTEKDSLTIGKNVTIGHSVVLHACIIGDSCLIGMGAVVLDGAKISKQSVVAAGSVVPPNKEFPPNCLILGNPAKVARELKPEEIELFANHYKSYLNYAEDFKDSNVFKKLS